MELGIGREGVERGIQRKLEWLMFSEGKLVLYVAMVSMLLTNSCTSFVQGDTRKTSMLTMPTTKQM